MQKVKNMPSVTRLCPQGFAERSEALRAFVIILLLPWLLLSCSNEIQINMQNDGLPVIYCVLDMNDTVQTVRLAKSFFPDEDYHLYDSMSVECWDEPVEIYFEEWTDPLKPTIHTCYPADTIRQDTGYFNNPSFSLFEAPFRPLPNTLYYLYAYFPNRNKSSFANTQTIDRPLVIDPAYIPGRKITFSDYDDFVVQFRPAPNAAFHQYSFTLSIEEHLSNGFQLDQFDFGSQIYEETNGQLVTRRLNSDRFFNNLLAQYDTLSGDEYRKIVSVEFILYSYGRELQLYNQLYNNGTQPWETQTYTSYKNGFGLFSSKAYTRLTNLELSELTYRLLSVDNRYKHMKFTQ